MAQEQKPEGYETHIVQTAEDTNGELLEIEAYYEPDSPRPPAHVHPQQSETFRVISGKITVVMENKTRVYETGESFEVPVGTPHAMWNDEEEPTVVRWEVRPALQSQKMFETFWGLDLASKSSGKRTSSLQLAVVLRAYNREFRMVSPPYVMQVLMFGMLSFFGRLRGYKPYYAKYDDYFTKRD